MEKIFKYDVSGIILINNTRPLFPYIITLQRSAWRWAAASFPPLPTTAHRQVPLFKLKYSRNIFFFNL